MTDKKANAHNLGKAQQSLPADQLCQLAENFKSFRHLRATVEVAIYGVLKDGVTNQKEKRFLILLRTIAANIDATGEMIQGLSGAKGVKVDLTEAKSQNAKLRVFGACNPGLVGRRPRVAAINGLAISFRLRIEEPAEHAQKLARRFP